MIFGIFLALLMLILLLSLNCTAISFLYMLTVLALEQWLQTKEVYFVQHTSFVNVTSGAIIMLVAILAIKKNVQRIPIFNNIYFMVMMLYCYAFISCFWSPVSSISILNYKLALPYIILSVFVAPLTVIDLRGISKAFIFYMFYGTCLLILLLFFSQWGYRTLILAGNYNSLYANPLALASLSGYLFISSVFLGQKSIIKYFKWVIVLLCLLLAVKTGSRGQFLFMITSVMLFLPFIKSKTGGGKMLKILIAFFLVFSAYEIILNFSGIESSGDRSRWSSGGLERDFTNRLAAAQNLLYYWMQSPISILFGLGSSASFLPKIFGFYVHMVPFEVLGELGLFGFSIYFLIIYKTVRVVIYNLKNKFLDQEDRRILITISAMCLFEFFLSLKQGSLINNVNFFGCIIVLSRIDSLIKIKTKKLKI